MTYLQLKLSEEKQKEINEQFQRFAESQLTEELLQEAFKESLKGCIKGCVHEIVQSPEFRRALMEKFTPIFYEMTIKTEKIKIG